MKMMNRYFLVALVWFLPGGMAFGQKYTELLLNQKVTVNYEDHTVTAYVKPVSTVITESGLFYTWFSGHQIRVTQGGYSGRLLNGPYQDFYLNKNLKEAGEYKDGLKDGVWKSWNEAGILKEEQSWSHGYKSGKQYIYTGLKTSSGADSVTVVYYRKGQVVQPDRLFPKNILPKNIVPGFIKRQFKKKAKN